MSEFKWTEELIIDFVRWNNQSIYPTAFEENIRTYKDSKQSATDLSVKGISETDTVFSTKEKAEEWVLMNRPLISVNEAIECIKSDEYNFVWIPKLKLIELAKSKINP